MSYESPRPERPARIYGTVRIHAQCAIGGCDGPAVAAVPVQFPYDTGVHWLCESHADAMPWFDGIHGRRSGPRSYDIHRTCRFNSLGVDLPPCGAAADHLVITEDETQQLGVASVCDRHARSLQQWTDA